MLLQTQCSFAGAWGGGHAPKAFYVSSYFWDRAVEAGRYCLPHQSCLANQSCLPNQSCLLTQSFLSNQSLVYPISMLKPS